MFGRLLVPRPWLRGFRSCASLWTPRQGEARFFASSSFEQQLKTHLCSAQPPPRASLLDLISTQEGDVQEILHAALEDTLTQEKLLPSIYLIEGLWKHGYPCRGQSIHRFVTLCKEQNQENTVTDLWNLSKQYQSQIFIQAANRILDIVVKNGDLDQAWQIFCDLGSTADAQSYNIMLHGLCKSNEVTSRDRVDQLQEQRAQANIPQDAFSYSILINHYIKEGLLEEASDLYEEMKQSQVPLSPYAATSLLREYCSQNMTDRALALLQDCGKRKTEIDEYMYSNLIYALCKSGNGGKALQCYKSLISTGKRPNLVTSSTLITGLCKSGETSLVTAAYRVFLEMKNDTEKTKEQIGIKVYSILVTALIDSAAPKEAMKVLNELVAAGHVPTTLLLNKVLEYLFRHLDFTVGMKFWQRMQSIATANVFTFNIIISYCFKNNQTALVPTLLEDMKRARVEPDSFTKELLRKNLKSKSRNK